jgi:hypothetical protein
MKWFALLGLVLFLGVAIAPSINAYDLIEEDTTDSIFGWILFRGLYLLPSTSGDNITFFAILFHYTEVTGMEIFPSFYFMEWVTLSKSSLVGYGSIQLPLGLYYARGWTHGSIEDL